MAMKTELQMAKDGEFLREYGKKFFVVAVEALDIGRIKWSMVPIGTKGQNAVEFFMTTDQMYNLCDEILNGTAEEKIKEDKGSFPGAYKFVTGENGDKRLNIGGGQYGCRIQAQNSAKDLKYLMAVSYEALKNMANRYLLWTGRCPVVSDSYYESVIKAFEAGRAYRAQNYGYATVSEEDTPAGIEEEFETVMPQPESVPEHDIRTVTLNVKGARKENDKYVLFDALNGSESMVLMFPKDEIPNISWFETMEKRALGDSGVNLRVTGEVSGKYLLFQKSAA